MVNLWLNCNWICSCRKSCPKISVIAFLKISNGLIIFFRYWNIEISRLTPIQVHNLYYIMSIYILTYFLFKYKKYLIYKCTAKPYLLNSVISCFNLCENFHILWYNFSGVKIIKNLLKLPFYTYFFSLFCFFFTFIFLAEGFLHQNQSIHKILFYLPSLLWCNIILFREQMWKF